MTTKLNAPVRTPNGEITTIDELAKAGRIQFSEVKNFHTRRGTCTKHFAEIDGTGAVWEISRFAYLSRTGQEVTITPALDSLLAAKIQCSYLTDPKRESTRCQKTSDDRLPYYEQNGARYCAEHGSQVKYAKKAG